MDTLPFLQMMLRNMDIEANIHVEPCKHGPLPNVVLPKLVANLH